MWRSACLGIHMFYLKELSTILSYLSSEKKYHNAHKITINTVLKERHSENYILACPPNVLNVKYIILYMCCW